MQTNRPGAIVTLLLLCSICAINARAASSDTAGFSAAALYNQANAYARAGKPGLAVLNYQRARLADPTDSDIRANMRFVAIAAGLPPTPDRKGDTIARLAKPDVFAWLGLAGVILFGSGVLTRRLFPQHRLKAAAAALFGVACVGATVCDAIALYPTVQGAVILVGLAPVRASPVPMGDPLFTLREAETVTSLGHHDSYVLIRTSAGRQGWISSENLAPIVPTLSPPQS